MLCVLTVLRISCDFVLWTMTLITGLVSCHFHLSVTNVSRSTNSPFLLGRCLGFFKYIFSVYNPRG